MPVYRFGESWRSGAFLRRSSAVRVSYGKRIDVDAYRPQFRGDKGVVNMKATPKVASIQLVDDRTEMMVISQFGKMIRIDIWSVRAAGRATKHRNHRSSVCPILCGFPSLLEVL